MFMKHEFVECIPEILSPETLYISIKFRTAVHQCPCGCRNEVVTPISPAEWEVSFNGESVSLYPSVGNWSLPCRSHYWISKGQIRWARGFSDEEVEMVRIRDQSAKEIFYSRSGSEEALDEQSIATSGKASDTVAKTPAKRDHKPRSRR